MRYKIKKGTLDHYLGECGHCYMIYKDQVIDILKEIESKAQKIIDKKELILSRVK